MFAEFIMLRCVALCCVLLSYIVPFVRNKALYIKRFVVRFSALQTMPPFLSFLYYLGQGRSCPRKHDSFVLHLGIKRLVTRHLLQLTFLRRNDVFFLNIGKSWFSNTVLVLRGTILRKPS